MIVRPPELLRATLRAPGAFLDEAKLIPGVRVFARRDSAGFDIKAPVDVAPRLQASLGCTFLGAARGSGEVSPPLLPDLPPRLFPWQRAGAEALVSGRKFGLWFAAGLGKTATLLVAAHATGADRVLAVTRAIGRDVFARDVVWAAPGRRVAIVVGTSPGGAVPKSALEAAAKRADKRLDDLRRAGSDCFVCTSVGEATRRGAWLIVIGWEVLAAHASEVTAWKPELALIDEAHCCKGRGLADRAKAALKIVRESSCVVWESTATPVPDRLRDLWAQLTLIDARAWGSSWSFVHRYCAAKPGRYGGLDSTGTSNLEELRDRLNYWFDARTRDEIKHLLPDKLRAIHRVKGGKGCEEEGEVSRPTSSIESAIARAADVKLGAVVDRAVEALIGGEKIVLVGNRRAWVGRAARAIERALARSRTVREKLWLRQATGEDEVSARQALAREFMAREGTAVLVATIDSIGVSIDLQDADRLIVAALPWTGGQVVQLEGRVHRLGQARPVAIDYFVAEGTYDEVVESSLLAKLGATENAGADTEGSYGLVGSGAGLPSEEEMLSGLRAWVEGQGARMAGAVVDREGEAA